MSKDFVQTLCISMGLVVLCLGIGFGINELSNSNSFSERKTSLIKNIAPFGGDCEEECFIKKARVGVTILVGGAFLISFFIMGLADSEDQPEE